MIFAGDLGRRHDQHLLDDQTLDGHPQDLLRRLRGLGGRLGELDPASLAPAASVDLRLHHDRATNSAGNRFRLRWG
jgi:hypothetical protein